VIITGRSDTDRVQPSLRHDQEAQARTPTVVSDATTLLLSYSGIGDGILCAPVLMELLRLGVRPLAFIANPGIDLLKRLRLRALNDVLEVSSSIRRMVGVPPDELVGELRRNHVECVINLRRDRVQHGDCYAAVASHLTRAGIRLSDVGEYLTPAQQATMHVRDLMSTYLTAIGLPIAQAGHGWLRGACHSPFEEPGQRASVGYFLGASQDFKRVPTGIWAYVISDVAAHTGYDSYLLFGVSSRELVEGRMLAQRLTVAGVPGIHIVDRVELPSLARLISGLRLVVSSDTFVVHLADALGVPVVGIYCSTDPAVYGPYFDRAAFVESSYYARCPLRNQMGNCNAWSVGCVSTPCKSVIDPGEVALLVRDRLLRASS
jgi:hypothetical protein